MRVVLLNSGGKDALAVAVLLHAGNEIHSLHIDLGNQTEAQSAEAIASKYAATHKVIAIGGGPFLAMSKFGYMVMPGKSLFHHAVGATYAYSIQADALASGQRDDVLVPDFPERLASALAMSKHRAAIPLLFPLRGFGQNSERVWGIVKDEPLWQGTAYCLQDPPCGTCSRCALRKRWLTRLPGSVSTVT